MSADKYPEQIPVLESKRLILRSLNDSDAKDIFEYASNPDITSFLIWDSHKSINDSLQFIKFVLQEFENKSSIIWGIEIKDEGKLIGTIDLRNFYNVHLCGEIGYVIGKEYWGKGYVTEAIIEIIRYGFTELSLNRIESHCEPENIGSWRVMEKGGMKYEGTLREKVNIKGRYRTMKMYSILKGEWNR